MRSLREVSCELDVSGSHLVPGTLTNVPIVDLIAQNTAARDRFDPLAIGTSRSPVTGPDATHIDSRHEHRISGRSHDYLACDLGRTRSVAERLPW